MKASTVENWQNELLGFRAKFEAKYSRSFDRPKYMGIKEWLRDIPSKFYWLTEKEDIVELRRRLLSASSTIAKLVLEAVADITSRR